MKNNNKCYLLFPICKTEKKPDLELMSVFISEEEANKSKSILEKCGNMSCIILPIHMIFENEEEYKEMFLNKVKNDMLKYMKKSKKNS